MNEHSLVAGRDYLPDWKIYKLNEIGDFSKGAGITKADLSEEGLPCIRYGEIYTTHDFVIKKFYSFISPEVAETSKEIFAGDILFTGSGETAEEIGKCVAYIGKEKAYAGGDVIILRLKNGDPEYLGYALNHEIVKRQKSRMGQGYSVVHIYASHLENVIVLFPPLPEQRKIAEILSTWDEAISKTEQLIAALRERKKGLMQRLLTGQVRFAGFDGEWKVTTFSEVIKLQIGRTPERNQSAYWDTSKKTRNVWLSISDLSGKYVTDSKEYISDAGIKASGATRIPKGTVLMSFKLTIGRVAIPMVDVYTNEAICALIPKDETVLTSRYLYHAISAVRFDKEIDQAVKGKTLNTKKIRRLDISLPCLEEQERIAGFLDELDDELASNQQYLSLLQQQKKGLMQRLLTGEVRVRV